MEGKMDAKVRIVRCPRCRRVLAEPPGVPVYECGGCGAKLQAKKRNNSTVDTTSHKPDEDSSGKRKVDRAFVDQEAGSSSNQQSLLNSTGESHRNSDHNVVHGSNKDQDAAKRVEDCSSDNLKIKQVSDNQEPCCSSKQQSLTNSTDDSHQNSDHNDLYSSYKDQNAAKRTENGIVDAPPSVVEEYSSEILKKMQLPGSEEPCCSTNQQSVVTSSDEPDQSIQNDPRSSTEFSGHEDPESSPEATANNKIDQEQSQKQIQSHYQDEGKQQENVTVVGLEHSSGKHITEQLSDGDETGNRFTQLLLVNPMNELDRKNDRSEHRSSSELSYHEDPESSPEATARNGVKRHETEFVSYGKETEIEESISEFDEAIANTRVISDSDGGSKSSFKNMIAEKLLDARQKKTVYLDEDDLLSEDGSADLRHRQIFGRISSVESMETARLGGTSYYGYEGSVSSLDGNNDQIPRKNDVGSVRDDVHVNSGNRSRFKRRSDHPLNGRLGKDEHQSTDVRSFYGLNEFRDNQRHRPSMIPENPKMERIELLKLLRELQDQLERTNILNPQQVPSYYNHVLNNQGRYGQRMAFSGEATAVNRRREGSLCHHCCPQDRHFSAQLPRHHVCCNGHNYGPNSYRSPQFSGPSSPAHIHSESDFSAPDDHWQQNDVRKPFRSPKKKQYVRPIAGGSPWITCYRCFKLLQLPQSFLLFNKRYHSLRCGACLKVLNFTLSDRTHVSRYYPEETIAAPPSSEAEDYDKLAGSWAGPVSCSDRSFEKSYSTETDRNGSREFSEERRKATMSRDPSGSTRPPSSRLSGQRTTTSEIEEVEPRPNGSPLHWLMGYASPSKVIRG